jgi:hypothetical protein
MVAVIPLRTIADFISKYADVFTYGKLDNGNHELESESEDFEAMQQVSNGLNISTVMMIEQRLKETIEIIQQCLTDIRTDISPSHDEPGR